MSLFLLAITAASNALLRVALRLESLRLLPRRKSSNVLPSPYAAYRSSPITVIRS
jgi:hypothetical protein